MINGIKSTYLTTRFFISFGIIAVLLALGFIVPVVFPLAQALLVVLLAVVLSELFILFNSTLIISCKRVVPKVLSLGSNNTIKLILQNQFSLRLKIAVVDELPYQLQLRNFEMALTILPGETQTLNYTLRPTKRGQYHFGKVNLFLQTAIGFIERKYSFDEEAKVAVYPSVIEMRTFELKTIARLANYTGIKKVHRLGHSYEFEQIKAYVNGDDYRSINWKATGRKASLMVNTFEDEKSQQIYQLIDNSRSMRMPFNGLSLLDYAINTSLVISNTALRKHDKAGLITFSNKIGTTLRADAHMTHLKKISDALYKEQEQQLEANFELLYYTICNFIKGRSLLFLYTNFESFYALERVLPILRNLNKLHLLVVVFFENTEIHDYSKRNAENIEQVYYKTIAQKFVTEKNQIVHQLYKYGIHSIFTRPEELSVNTVNKYLELKSRGMI